MKKVLNELIAKNVTIIRERKGYSKRELARLASLDEKQIRRIEDPNTSSSMASIRKVADALECSVQDILLDHDVKHSELYCEIEVFPNSLVVICKRKDGSCRTMINPTVEDIESLKNTIKEV